MNREEGIRMIAYHIWEEEGCKSDGRDVEHWLKAETVWEESNKPVRTATKAEPWVRKQQTNAAGNAKPATDLSMPGKKATIQKGILSTCEHLGRFPFGWTNCRIRSTSLSLGE